MVVFAVTGILVCSAAIYGGFYWAHKLHELKQLKGLLIIRVDAQEAYMSSREAELLNHLQTSSNTYSSVFESLQGEPLMIISTEEQEHVLKMTLLGSTEKLINWINTMEEKHPTKSIEIEHIERKGNSVFVHCEVKPST